ncbi:MAG: hypothetical protein IKC27_03115 [Kiritimatiellae bacterium]|nr:hypothetical protein [Kiritimatiellia bacterium]
MKIKELQTKIADALNGCEELVQGSCRAIVEDSMTVASDIQKQLQTVKGVAIVVMTPTFTRNGSRADGLPVEAQLTIQCVEVPEHNRLQSGRLTALDAAEIVASALDSNELNFVRIAQTADAATRSIIVQVDFNVSIILN